MKRITFLFAVLLIALSANCQSSDKTFGTVVKFNQGIQFADNSVLTTAPTGSGNITSLPWSAITGKPTTLSGYGITNAALSSHTHASLYKPLSYMPAWSEITGVPSFATVATTGRYDDLLNKPTTKLLSNALVSLKGLPIPSYTSAQISAMAPTSVVLVWNSTDGVLQIYTGKEWKVIITNK